MSRKAEDVRPEEERRGRWHGLVYIDVPRSRALGEVARRRCDVEMSMGQLHVSLSRPFSLFMHEIDPFVGKLRACLMSKCLSGAFDLQVLDDVPVRYCSSLCVLHEITRR